MLQFSLFEQFDFIEHGITVAGETAPDDVVLGEQTHKAVVQWIEEHQSEWVPRIDALATRKAGIAVGVRHADCVPLLFVEPKRGVVGAIHAGWRGTALEITRKTLEFLKFPAHNVYVGIGPAIGPDSFVVGQEVAEQFPRSCVTEIGVGEEGSDYAGEKQFRVDLWEANKLQLLEVGVKERNIEVIRRDTFTDSELYSFRGGDREPRNISWIRKK